MEYGKDAKTNVKIAIGAMVAILIYFTLHQQQPVSAPPPRPIEMEQVK